MLHSKNQNKFTQFHVTCHMEFHGYLLNRGQSRAVQAQ